MLAQLPVDVVTRSASRHLRASGAVCAQLVTEVKIKSEGYGGYVDVTMPASAVARVSRVDQAADSHDQRYELGGISSASL